MPPDTQHHDTNLPQPCDRIAEMFGVPTRQPCASRDASPATPQPPGRLHAVLSWLWQFLLEGCAAYAFGMYPYFPEQSDTSDLFGPRRGAAAKQAAVAPPEQSPWQYEPLPRRRPPIAREWRHATLASYLDRHLQPVHLRQQPGRPMSPHPAKDSTVADIELGKSEHGSAESQEI
jgi:hypothetical protein